MKSAATVPSVAPYEDGTAYRGADEQEMDAWNNVKAG